LTAVDALRTVFVYVMYMSYMKRASGRTAAMSVPVVGPDAHLDGAARIDYATSATAREHFAEVLDAAANGRAVTIGRRGHPTAAVMDAETVRRFLAREVPANARVAIEDGRYIVILEGEPFVSEGRALDEAIDDMVVVLREYSEDWFARLKVAPNHEHRWGLATLVKLSSDQQLAQWLAA
jgi:prevent-host-death family protein